MRRQVAICIGIDNYVDEHIKNLQCAWADAQAFSLALHDLGFADINLLPSTVDLPAVEALLNRIGPQLREGDLFVFYFAGHGHTITGFGGQHDQLFLLPGAKAANVASGNLLGTTGLLNWQTLQQTTDQWQGVQRLFIFDACRAPLFKPESSFRGGDVFEGEAVFRNAGLRPERAAASPKLAPGCAVLNSCSEGQLAEELNRYPGGKGRGKFTAALVDAIRHNNSLTTDQTLVADLHQRMQALGSEYGSGQGQQQPMLAGAVITVQGRQASSPPAPPAPPPGPSLVELMEAFERQLAAAQLWQPASDCCVTSLAAMELQVQRTGQGAALLAACRQRLEQAMSPPSAPAPAPLQAPVSPSQPVRQSSPPEPPKPVPLYTGGPTPPLPSRQAAGGAVFPWRHVGIAAAAVGLLLAGFAQRDRLFQRAPAIDISAAAAIAAQGAASRPMQPLMLKMDGLPAEQVKAGQQAWAQALGLPVVFQDAMKSGGQGPEMVVIPAGEFTIGSGEEERKKYVEAGAKQEWADWEKPVSGIRLGAYAMGKTEVTVGQYAAFVKATGYSGSKGCNVLKDGAWKQDEQADWSKPGFDQGQDHPVVCVSWKDAKAYVAWLSQETGKEYRLASEAEWENGARAGTRTRRYWGDDWADDQACDYANGADLSLKEKFNWSPTFNCRDAAVYTAGVKGNRKPNALGLYDMLGNAWEWVEDCFVESYSGLSKEGKPQQCAQAEARRVVRGGAWDYVPRGLRSADRDGGSPGDRSGSTGFRLARTF